MMRFQSPTLDINDWKLRYIKIPKEGSYLFVSYKKLLRFRVDSNFLNNYGKMVLPNQLYTLIHCNVNLNKRWNGFMSRVSAYEKFKERNEV